MNFLIINKIPKIKTIESPGEPRFYRIPKEDLDCIALELLPQNVQRPMWIFK